jgi:hypothetical protein
MFDQYKNLKNINEFNIASYYDINIVDATEKLAFKFNNIIDSYSLIVFIDKDVLDNKTVERNNLDYAGVGMTRDLIGYNQQDAGGTTTYYIGFIYNNEKYMLGGNTPIQITNIFAYNSFFLGQTITNFNVHYNNITTSPNESVTIPLNESVTIGNDEGSLIFNPTGKLDSINDKSYYLSLYGTQFKGDDYTTQVYYTNPVKFFISENATKVGYVEKFYIGDILLTSQGYSDVYKYDDNSSKPSVTLNQVYIANTITDSGFNVGSTSSGRYLKYFNKDIDNSIPLPFAMSDTFEQNNQEYVNVIINIVPTILEVEGATTNFKNTWISSIESTIQQTVNEAIENFQKLEQKNTTIYFYELNYADSLTNKAAYDKMPWQNMIVNGETERVIDLNADGRYSTVDIEYSRYLNSLIDEYNTYKTIEIDPWHRAAIDKSTGIWIGDGAGTQISIKINNMSLDEKKVIFPYIGYTVYKGKHTLIKYMIDKEEKQNEE